MQLRQKVKLQWLQLLRLLDLLWRSEREEFPTIVYSDINSYYNHPIFCHSLHNVVPARTYQSFLLLSFYYLYWTKGSIGIEHCGICTRGQLSILFWRIVILPNSHIHIQRERRHHKTHPSVHPLTGPIQTIFVSHFPIAVSVFVIAQALLYL